MKKTFIFIIKLNISIGILYYIFITIPINEVCRSIKLASPFYILTALIFRIILVFVSALRIKILTDKQNMSLSVLQITKINFITQFYGLLLPGYLAGGVIRWYRLSINDNKKVEALAALAFSRINYTIVLIILGLVFLTIEFPGTLNGATISILLAFLASLILIYWILFYQKSFRLLNRMNQTWLNRRPRSLWNWLNKLLLATRQYHGLSYRSLSIITGLSLIENLLGVLLCYAIAIGLRINISFIIIGWVRSVISVVTALPISFSGLGVREGSLILLLNPYGVTATGAVALSLIIYSFILIIGMIGGVLEAIKYFNGR